MNVLIVGKLTAVVDEARRQLHIPDVQLVAATGLDEVKSAIAEADIDHVIIGAGLDRPLRLEIVREVLTTCQKATVHLKDVASGPDRAAAIAEGQRLFLPFVRSVIIGLHDYESEVLNDTKSHPPAADTAG